MAVGRPAAGAVSKTIRATVGGEAEASSVAHIPMVYAHPTVGNGSAAQQARGIFAQLDKLLQAAGSSRSRLLFVTAMLSDGAARLCRHYPA